MRTEEEVVRLVCEALVAAGWQPDSVDHDDEVDTATVDEMMAEAVEVEDCRLWFKKNRGDYTKYAVMLVFWQGVDCRNASEAIADYHTGDFGAVVDAALDPIIEEERNADF